MSHGPRTGVLGGTFDPVHLGHVETALAARRALNLDRVLFMPSGTPPHRHQQPAASRFHRFAMAALAVTGQEGLAVSDLEIGESGPSYTFETLTRLQLSGVAAAQIFFITGADAFAEIETWSRYPQVLDMAHFVVVSRPGHPAGRIASALPALANRMRAVAADVQGGSRAPSALQEQVEVLLVDATTPDVSSTEIRRRLETGAPVRGMLPEAVETYIRQHGLYAAGGAAPDRGRTFA